MEVRRWLLRHGIPTRPPGHHMCGSKNPRLGRRLSVETRKKISRAHEGRERTEESCRKQSESTRGPKNHRYGKERGHGRGAWVVTRDGETIFMRSRWEVYFADWLCEQGKPWRYESCAYRFKDGSLYTPDFLSEGVYYEVKGWMNESDRVKVEKFRMEYSGLALVIIDKAALKRLGVDVDRALPVKHLHISGERVRNYATCGKPFLPARKSSKCCSLSCASKQRPEKPTTFITCRVCGKTVRVFPSALGHRKTCSVKCGNISSGQQRSGENHWNFRKR